MEPLGKNHPILAVAVIPARYESTRLPGKMLREIAGKPLILHTLERAREAATVSRVIVATDDERIRDVVANAGGEAVMTSTDHRSGTDRLAEVAETLPAGTIVVNVQGDEPLISPDTIDLAVRTLANDPEAQISTVSETIESAYELFDPNNVKVICGESGYALGFSRSVVPYLRDAALRHNGDIRCAIENEPELLQLFQKHAGLYVYRREYLLEFANMQSTELERTEMLEQLRALENGAKIRVVEAAGKSIGVDTLDDLELVRAIFASGELSAAEIQIPVSLQK